MQPDQPVKHSPKKAIIAIAASLVLVAALSAGVAFTLKLISHTSNDAAQKQTDTKNQAQSEYSKAQDALKSGNIVAAKDALIKARDLYTEIKDSSYAKEIKSQLTILEKTTQAKPGQAPAASSSL